MKELSHQVQRVIDKINSGFPIKNRGKQKTVELKKTKTKPETLSIKNSISSKSVL